MPNRTRFKESNYFGSRTYPDGEVRNHDASVRGYDHVFDRVGRDVAAGVRAVLVVPDRHLDRLVVGFDRNGKRSVAGAASVNDELYRLIDRHG